MKPKMIGTINGRIPCKAKFNGKPFDFDGTLRGLDNAARAAGATDGDTISAEFCNDYRDYVMSAESWPTRN
jgi:hypothetical protein